MRDFEAIVLGIGVALGFYFITPRLGKMSVSPWAAALAGAIAATIRLIL